MPGSRALVVGDVIDDIIVVPSGPVRPDTDTAASITRHPGGSACNTAAWLGWLGAPVDLVGRVGSGDAGRHASALRASGVTPHLGEDPALPTGTIVIVVDGETRTMLTDRGANATLAVTAVTDALLDGAAVLHLTGYSLFDAFSLDDLAALVGRARARGVLVTFDPGSTGFIADYGLERFRRALAHVDVLLPNLDEGRLLSGEHDRAAVAEALLVHCPAVVITGGSSSVLVARRGESAVEVAVEARRAVDPTGAGDAFTAGLIAAMLGGADLVEAARAGVRAAGVAVTHAGGRPPVVS
ncbi:carbohydrate kinase family protein [Microcella sp.]|uniref:carbohydrate kinase family protein n=1 Tax=Microcella sp. TaxID=1913979 RepID=UPI003F70AA1A